MFKKIAIISLFLFLPFFSYASDNRLLDQYDEWKAEQDKKATVSQPSNTEQENGQPILYRNDDYKFRINFPAGWEIKDGDGAHVVKKAVKDGCTILVLVKDSQEEKNTLSDQEKNALDSVEFSDLSNEEANQLLDEMIKENEIAFPGGRIIEKEIRYIDNRKAGYYKVATPYKVANVEAKVVAINYFTIHKGKFYQIIGSYPIEPVNEQNKEPVINTSLMTFVFEDWSDQGQALNTANDSKNSSNPIKEALGYSYGENLNNFGLFLAVILSILFTWGLGLLIPILIRFVFLKRPLSGGLSFLIVFITYLIQFSIPYLIGDIESEDRPRIALILVAFVAYKILRKKVSNKTNDKESEISKEEIIKYCKECGDRINASSIICDKCHIQKSKKRRKELLLAFLAIILITMLILFVAVLFS